MESLQVGPQALALRGAPATLCAVGNGHSPVWGWHPKGRTSSCLAVSLLCPGAVFMPMGLGCCLHPHSEKLPLVVSLQLCSSNTVF